MRTSQDNSTVQTPDAVSERPRFKSQHGHLSMRKYHEQDLAHSRPTEFHCAFPNNWLFSPTYYGATSSIKVIKDILKIRH